MGLGFANPNPNHMLIDVSDVLQTNVYMLGSCFLKVKVRGRVRIRSRARVRGS